MAEPKNVLKNEIDETRKSISYLTARTFIKDFGDPAPIVTIPYFVLISVYIGMMRQSISNNCKKGKWN